MEETTNLKKKNEDTLRKIEKGNDAINEEQKRLATMIEEYEENKKFLENLKMQDMNKLVLLKNEVIQNLRVIDQAKKEYLLKFQQILEENNWKQFFPEIIIVFFNNYNEFW